MNTNPPDAASDTPEILYSGYYARKISTGEWDKSQCGELQEDNEIALVEGYEWQKVVIVPEAAIHTLERQRNALREENYLQADLRQNMEAACVAAIKEKDDATRELTASQLQITMDTECIERIRKHGITMEIERDEARRERDEALRYVEKHCVFAIGMIDKEPWEKITAALAAKVKE